MFCLDANKGIICITLYFTNKLRRFEHDAAQTQNKSLNWVVEADQLWLLGVEGELEELQEEFQLSDHRTTVLRIPEGNHCDTDYNLKIPPDLQRALSVRRRQRPQGVKPTNGSLL